MHAHPDPATYSDEEYIAGVRQGDEAVFTAMVRTYLDPLARFAFGMTGAEDITHDVVQDVFTAVWRLGESWNPKGSVSAYLFTAVRYRILDSAKANRARERMQGELQRQIDTATTTDGFSDVALTDLVRRELQSLTSRQRDALRLRYEQGMTMAQVATVLEIDLTAAKKLVARALLSLRTRLSHIQDDFE